MTVKLNDVKSIEEFVNEVFKQRKLVKKHVVLVEEAPQQPQQIAPPPDPQPAQPDADDTGFDVVDDEDEETLREGDVTPEDIVTTLNAIRAGRSFRDEDISRSLNKYFNELDVAERTALFAFLKGIKEIVSGVMSGAEATEPADPSPAVAMKKKNLPQENESQVEQPTAPKAESPPSDVSQSGGQEKQQTPQPPTQQTVTKKPAVSVTKDPEVTQRKRTSVAPVIRTTKEPRVATIGRRESEDAVDDYVPASPIKPKMR